MGNGGEETIFVICVQIVLARHVCGLSVVSYEAEIIGKAPKSVTKNLLITRRGSQVRKE